MPIILLLYWEMQVGGFIVPLNNGSIIINVKENLKKLDFISPLFLL